MSITTTVLTPRTIIAANTAIAAAGAAQRGVLDMRGDHGGLLTMKITNGGTTLTAQAECRVLIAHDAGATPAAASAGAVWKTHFVFGGGLVANAITEQSFVMPPCCHLEVEVVGNQTGAITCEAFMSEYTNLTTV
jgi:hypothetical protein